MKRAFDIVASALAVLALSPMLLPIMIILRLTGEGKIFYAQERIGRGGKRFRILKFATMLENSPNLTGGDITIDRDPRILPTGRFLRNTKINELPQLFNILLGDMSIIGPRPLTPNVARLFPDDYWRDIAHLRPGLSGIGSIVFRDEEALLRGAMDRQTAYSQMVVPYKMVLELWYAKHPTVGTDLKLIFLTVLAISRPGLKFENYVSGLPPPPTEILRLRE
jgi:lipopolysaccharide/colanic/teichoic acid biosynthesis glycosyltransferase